MNNCILLCSFNCVFQSPVAYIADDFLINKTYIVIINNYFNNISYQNRISRQQCYSYRNHSFLCRFINVGELLNKLPLVDSPKNRKFHQTWINYEGF